MFLVPIATVKFKRKNKCKSLAFIGWMPSIQCPLCVCPGATVQNQTEGKGSFLREQMFKWEMDTDHKEIPSEILTG